MLQHNPTRQPRRRSSPRAARTLLQALAGAAAARRASLGALAARGAGVAAVLRRQLRARRRPHLALRGTDAAKLR